MKFMPDIAILADLTTGKLIQKYLNRPSVEVAPYSSETSMSLAPVSLYIIDVSGLHEEIGTVIPRLSASSGCERYILITSMDNPMMNNELGFLLDRWAVHTIAKPIKLSELKRIVDQLNVKQPLRTAN